MNARDRQSGSRPAAPAQGSAVPAPEASIPNIDGRFGTGRAQVTAISALDSQGRRLREMVPAGRLSCVSPYARASGSPVLTSAS